MADRREQLAEHLRFFEELGVAGYRRDPVWSSRPADLQARPIGRGPMGRSADLQVGPIGSSADLQVGPEKADLKVSTTTNVSTTTDVGPPDVGGDNTAD